MQTVGVKAVALMNGAEVLIPGEGTWLILFKAVDGIFVNVEMTRHGVKKRTWFYVDDIVNKVI